MGFTEAEKALLEAPTSEPDHGHQRYDRAPAQDRKIGKYTVVLLILNRTIGSGIFLMPHKVLAGTGCVGGMLFLWFMGAILSLCGLYVWLECGLSMPRKQIQGENEPRGVPRSGGEKNFLEFMFPNKSLDIPHIRTTCSFSIMFVLLYNLSGNSISFALQVMQASGIYDPAQDEKPDQATAVGIALAVLTLVVILHMISRRGGIWLNNILALVKVALLLAIICLGMAKAAGAFSNREGPSNAEVIRKNFRQDVWTTRRKDVSSWSTSLMLCMYSFSGFEQPFYVLAECKGPRRNLPKYTVLAMIIAIILYFGVNISYLLVIDRDLVLDDPTYTGDFASAFFEELFGGDHQQAARSMSALIAVSIFGNLVVMTFTAARVKQEIAKEGILPWSLSLATSYPTPYGLFKKWRARGNLADWEIEHAPTAAFILHWLTSILLVLLTLPVRDPRYAYSALVSLYTYAIIGVIGFWVSGGLLMLKHQRERWGWKEPWRRYKPWPSPVHAIVYCAASGFMLIASFIPPTKGSPFHKDITGIDWYIIPAIGLSAPLWGVLYYGGFVLYQNHTGQQLVVTRQAYCEIDPDSPSTSKQESEPAISSVEYVQHTEIVDINWQLKTGAALSTAFTEDEANVGLAEESFIRRERPASVRNGRRTDADSVPTAAAASNERPSSQPEQISNSF